MSRKVVPLRPTAERADDRTVPPRIWARIISHEPGLSRDALVDACRELERLVRAYEPRLTAVVAKIVQDKLPAVETWVGAIVGSSQPSEEDLVDVAPRDNAVDMAEPWPLVHRGLLETPPVDRLDIVAEARSVIGLFSLDPQPALPVTRKQAEAAHLPAHLLFARGEAFASLSEEPANQKVLLEAFVQHRALVEESAEELLDGLRGELLGECAGVVLALGPEGSAVSTVTREQAARLLADRPFLARKLERRGSPGKLKDGRDITTIPIVVWAKGHVSIQTRDVVEAD